MIKISNKKFCGDDGVFGYYGLDYGFVSNKTLKTILKNWIEVLNFLMDEEFPETQIEINDSGYIPYALGDISKFLKAIKESL